MEKVKKITRTLTPKQLKKFCNIFGLEPNCVESLNAISCLNVDYIRTLLIKADFSELKSGLTYIETVHKKYSYEELKRALAMEYATTPAEIHDIIKDSRNSNLIFCKCCGRRINHSVNLRTGGLCSSCMANKLEL